MAEERIKRLEEKQAEVSQKQSGFERWGWKTISSIIMGLGVALLNGINSNLKELNEEIVSIKLSDSANNQKMTHLSGEVAVLKINEKELSKRVGDLEKSKERHDQRLNNLER